MRRLFKNEIFSHLLIYIIYFLLLGFFRFKLDLNLVLLFLGGLVGTFLFDIDHLLYWFVLHPEAEDSQKAKILFSQKNYQGMYRLLTEVHQTHTRMAFHSAIIQIVLLIIAFFIITSGGSFFGSGLVIAMNLHLLKDIWSDYLTRGAETTADWLFWQIKGVDTVKYFKVYLIIISLLFLGLTVFII